MRALPICTATNSSIIRVALPQLRNILSNDVKVCDAGMKKQNGTGLCTALRITITHNYFNIYNSVT